MPNDPKVLVIPKREPLEAIPVGIYCRVSTNSSEQLKSLVAQVSGLTRIVASNRFWKVADIYIDIASAKTDSVRPEFNRMVNDCKKHKIEIVITKNISRFGRDTVEILDTVNILRELNVRLIFNQESIDTKYDNYNVLVSCISAYIQAENESRSADIKWGIEQKASDGTSKLYKRKCYGYSHDAKGNLIINEEEAKIVRLIFDWYLSGKSILGILEELDNRKIKSPTGKDNWCKRSVDTILSNLKYTGDVILKVQSGNVSFLAKGNNPAIISKVKFDAVQLEKQKRCNITVTSEGKKRKNQKYSSKKL